MLNRYEKAANDLIAKKQKMPLHLIVGRTGEPATWDDQYWKISNLQCSHLTFPLTNVLLTSNGKSARAVPQSETYPDVIRHLLMCYLLELRTKYGLVPNIQDKMLVARHLVSRLNVFSFSQQTLSELLEKGERVVWKIRAGAFIDWLQEHNIVPKTIKVSRTALDARSEDGDIMKEKREKNMPDERAMYAMCAIRNKIIPSNVPHGVYQRHLRDELIVSSATLGLGSPSRSGAEHFVLPKMTVQSKIVTLDGKKQRVHWLDWLGSKGYQANRKHFFRGAKDAVSEVLSFWNEVGEPARILCRFFENPRLPLCDLLGDYQPTNLAQFDVSQPIDNMFVLGYLLGFYEGQSQTVALTPGAIRARNKPTKKIPDLTLTDKVLYGSECQVLFGTHPIHLKRHPKEHAIFYGVHTIGQLQDKWLAYIRQKVPTFPYRIVRQNKVKLSHALFIGTGEQLIGTGPGYAMGKSCYAIESIILPSAVRVGLRNLKAQTLFTRHNFADDISLNPYELRHWGNTMMQKSRDVSDTVIAMVSGRVSIEQNGEYDNRSDDQKMAPIQNLFRKEQTDDEMKKEVRVRGHQEYMEATGKVATLTSTGACTQNMAVNPCTYLNDFETHCSLCSSSCHFAHDEKAICLLEADLKVQQSRLNNVRDNDDVLFDAQLQSWFKLHHRNTALLEQLIILMKREGLELGTAIKYVGRNNTFRLTDLDKRLVEEVKVLLPDSEDALRQLIDSKQSEPEAPSKDEQNLNDLLAEFGVGAV